VLLPGRPYVFCVMITRRADRSAPRGERSSTDELLENLSRAALIYFTAGKPLPARENKRSN
jgi:hypothetical protein